MSGPRFRFYFALLCLLACVKRAIIFSLGPAASIGDQAGYWAHGELAAGGDWLLLGSQVNFWTPLYPMF
jgi:hypothetical protein